MEGLSAWKYRCLQRYRNDLIAAAQEEDPRGTWVILQNIKDWDFEWAETLLPEVLSQLASLPTRSSRSPSPSIEINLTGYKTDPWIEIRLHIGHNLEFDRQSAVALPVEALKKYALNLVRLGGEPIEVLEEVVLAIYPNLSLQFQNDLEVRRVDRERERLEENLSDEDERLRELFEEPLVPVIVETPVTVQRNQPENEDIRFSEEDREEEVINPEPHTPPRRNKMAAVMAKCRPPKFSGKAGESFYKFSEDFECYKTMAGIDDGHSFSHLLGCLRGEAEDLLRQEWRTTRDLHNRYADAMEILKKVYYPEKDRESAIQSRLWSLEKKKGETVKDFAKRLMDALKGEPLNDLFKKTILQKLLKELPHSMFFQMQELMTEMPDLTPYTFITEALSLIEGAPNEDKLKKKIGGEEDEDDQSSDSSTTTSSDSETDSDSDDSHKKNKKSKKKKKKKKGKKENKNTLEALKKACHYEPKQEEADKKIDSIKTDIEQLTKQLGQMSVNFMEFKEEKQKREEQRQPSRDRNYRNQRFERQGNYRGNYSNGNKFQNRGGYSNQGGYRGSQRGGYQGGNWGNSRNYQSQGNDRYQRGGGRRPQGDWSSQGGQGAGRTFNGEWTNMPEPQRGGPQNQGWYPPQGQQGPPQGQHGPPPNQQRTPQGGCTICCSIYHTPKDCPELKNR